MARKGLQAGIRAQVARKASIWCFRGQRTHSRSISNHMIWSSCSSLVVRRPRRGKSAGSSRLCPTVGQRYIGWFLAILGRNLCSDSPHYRWKPKAQARRTHQSPVPPRHARCQRTKLWVRLPDWLRTKIMNVYGLRLFPNGLRLEIISYYSA